MTIQETYNYLGRARRDLWTTLERVPDQILSKPLLNGSRFHSIKDLLNHIPAVEDGWINEDILTQEPVRKGFPALWDTGDEPVYAGFALSLLLDYWRLVEQNTLRYLAALTGDELLRVVVVHDSADERYTVDGLLWHVLIHEIRHTAQIAVLLRMQDIKPPFLDLLNYLPSA